MKDLDTLRVALTQQRPPGDKTLDIDHILTKGRRLRRRRRVALAAGTMCVIAGVFGATTGITHLARPAPVPAQRPAAPAKPSPRLSPRGHGTPTPAISPSEPRRPSPTPTETVG